MSTIRSGLLGRASLLSVLTLLLCTTGCGRSTVWYGVSPDGGGGGQEICDNGKDDDGDGFIDCQDSDCKGHPACSSKPEQCTNGIDDDGDGLTDCNDPDCFTHPSCKTLPENCTNGVDDDGDGLIDCQDPWCFKHPACAAKKEICNNGVDDDKDGLIDCNDPDCKSDPYCKKNENCTNGVDDDGDGFTDCQDSDCKNHPACSSVPENCSNGVDDDGDGLVDCNDPDCFKDPKCQTTPEICTNGKDDDGDGLVDCKDPNCFNHPACAAKKEICDNKKDDDGDGLTDCADPDCYTDPACTGKKEICNNKVDDDGDGLIDCKDPDCKYDPACIGPGKELCTNGVDDDGDKLVDCDDPDCKTDPSCLVKKEICNNKKDDDGDGLVDCNDPDCYKHPDCKTPGKEICNNGVDDDNDGDIDCADSECKWLPICKPGKEICNNKKDDDGDGAVDCDDPDCKSDPACQQVLCKPTVNFGTIKPKGSSATRTVTTTGTTDIYTTTCVIPGGGEVVAQFILSGKTDLKLTYEQLSGDVVFGLFAAGLKEACNANAKGCYDPKSAKKGEFSIKNLTAGTYYLFTEAFAKTLEGKTKITLSTGQVASKEICNNGKDDDLDGAIDCADLDCYFHAACKNNQCKWDVNLGTLVVNGGSKTTTVNTATAANTYDLVCAAGGGGDRVVRFAMPSTAVLGVTVYQSGGGYHAFGLFHDKGPGTKCNADKGSCLQKTWPGIVIDYGTKEKGVYYYIVDEMKKGSGGNVQLSFKAYANRGPELCTNNIDDDGDGLVDCMDPDCTGVVGCPGPVCVPDKKTGAMAIGSQVSFNVDTTKANNDQTVSCALGGGKDEVIEIILTQTTALRVSCNQTGDHVLGLFTKGASREPCDKSSNARSCADPKTGPIGCNFFWGNMQPGTYYLVVEAFKPGTEGTMNITLRATKDSVQEICNNGKDDDGDGKIDCQDYNCATSPYCTGKTCTPEKKLGLMVIGKATSVALTTTGAGDSNTTSCSKGGGEDYVVSFTLPKAATLTVDYAQFGDHVLALHTDKGVGYSCDSAPVKCVASGGKTTGKATYTGLKAGQYFLVVDASASGKEGSVVLNMTAK